MSLPGTPGGGQQISMSEINIELGRSSTDSISLNTAEDGGYATINTCSFYRPSASNPATMNEWHGYNHSATCKTIYVYGNMGTSGYNFSGYVYYKIGSNGTPAYLGSISSDTCYSVGNVYNIPVGTTVYFYCENASNNTQIYFYSSESSTCPGNSDNTCYQSVYVSSDMDFAITIYNFPDGSGSLTGGPRYCT